MALTPTGDALTRAHRDEQILLAARAAGEAEVFWSELNPADPMPWAYTAALMIEDQKRQSSRLSRAYLQEFGYAETGSPVTVESPRPNLDLLIGLTVVAGVRELENLPDTLTPGDVRDRFAEIVAAETQRTYREMVANNAGSQRKAWRRVAQANACAFCAMLASRGPVYTETTASIRKHDGLRYHRGCKCTAEPWYGEWSEWRPTPQEQPYVDAYFEAALQAESVKEMRVAPKTIRDLEGNITGRTEDTILWRMRRNRPDLFSDGVKSPAV